MGQEDGHLAPCPDSPNCVSSRTPDDGHRVEPLTFVGDPATAFAALRDVLRSMPRTRIVSEGACYLHAEARTRWLRFTDDVALQLDAEAGVVHVRSASRIGYSDLGANRARVERLRSLWRQRPESGH